MTLHFCRLFAASSICLLFALSATMFANSYVTYDADTLPQDNPVPFTFDAGGIGTQSVSNGILTVDVTSDVGGLEYFRLDPLTYQDLAVFQFRTRTTRVDTPSSGATSGAVALFQWTGSKQGYSTFFLRGSTVNIHGGNLPNTNPILNFDTTQFHTYTIVKNRDVDIELFIDGIQKYIAPFDKFVADTNLTFVPVQKFEGNPTSTSEWDFVRYAIGDDALIRIPLPEPATSVLLCTAVISCGLRRGSRCPSR
jgi:hypothetical protein